MNVKSEQSLFVLFDRWRTEGRNVFLRVGEVRGRAKRADDIEKVLARMNVKSLPDVS
ncbi:hypothetical protein CA13_16770 [Planctomycetes bacterium CA13]|uniref:Uncharacterized protein n=1 Tax=Novipirellula herctigrandis TaxID=2527986 RepID=A0A5C5YYY2_9BACT|nr:hypothetical protein CA13_16770 [Planctomycetes bacterium CA13]